MQANDQVDLGIRRREIYSPLEGQMVDKYIVRRLKDFKRDQWLSLRPSDELW